MIKKYLCLKCNPLHWFDSVRVCLQYRKELAQTGILVKLSRAPSSDVMTSTLFWDLQNMKLTFFAVCNYFLRSISTLENHFLLQWVSACVCENEHRNFQDFLYNHELLSIVAHMYTKISSHQSFQIFMQLNKGELECTPSAFQNCSECTRKHRFRPWWLKQSFPLRVATLPPLPQHHLHIRKQGYTSG